MKKFKYVTESRQVYSQDLDQILQKTPPAIFTRLLLALAGLVGAAVLFLLLVNVTPRQQLACRLEPMGGPDGTDSVLVSFVAEDFLDATNVRQLTLGVTDVGTQQLAVTPLAERLTDFTVETCYFLAGELVSGLDKVGLDKIDEARTGYRYHTVLPNHTGAKAATIGVLSIQRDDITLFKKIFG